MEGSPTEEADSHDGGEGSIAPPAVGAYAFLYTCCVDGRGRFLVGGPRICRVSSSESPSAPKGRSPTVQEGPGAGPQGAPRRGPVLADRASTWHGGAPGRGGGSPVGYAQERKGAPGGAPIPGGPLRGHGGSVGCHCRTPSRGGPPTVKTAPLGGPQWGRRGKGRAPRVGGSGPMAGPGRYRGPLGVGCMYGGGSASTHPTDSASGSTQATSIRSATARAEGGRGTGTPDGRIDGRDRRGPDRPSGRRSDVGPSSVQPPRTLRWEGDPLPWPDCWSVE